MSERGSSSAASNFTSSGGKRLPRGRDGMALRAQRSMSTCPGSVPLSHKPSEAASSRSALRSHLQGQRHEATGRVYAKGLWVRIPRRALDVTVGARQPRARHPSVTNVHADGGGKALLRGRCSHKRRLARAADWSLTQWSEILARHPKGVGWRRLELAYAMAQSKSDLFPLLQPALP
eukprot:scaffold2923_cov313-Pinguiococcus_pyrenoidosus.AAC.16